MRRISTGIQGRSILGSFVAETNRFTTREANQDLVLEPAGTGIIRAEKHVKINGTAGSLILETDNGNEVVLQTASGSGYTLTMPTDTPAAGEVLISDASGNLTFDDINLPVSNQTADTAAYYPLMNTATSGDITSLSVSSSKLSFQPSSGTLTVTDISATDITCTDITASGDLEAGTITETSSRALKTDINPISNAIDTISALDGVSYTRISSGRREAGLIAEEVEKVLPELVDSKGEYKSISYSRLTAYLIEAVKSLKTELDTVKNG